MNTCKDCKHWKRFNDEMDIKYGGGPDAGNCMSDKFIYESGQAPANALAYWDYEGYAAGFHTGQDFGCIHWTQPVTK